jgi:hypothetical protein
MRIFFLVKRHFCLLFIVSFFYGFHFTSFAQDSASEIKSLSEGADVIVIGKVVQQKSNWNENRTRIYTNVTIKVEEFLKGTNTGEIVVTHPGGEVGEVGELYTHMPKFRNDEEVLVFLEEDTRSNAYRVLNGENGKMTLLKDKTTGEKVTPFNQKISTFKNEIKKYIGNQQ